MSPAATPHRPTRHSRCSSAPKAFSWGAASSSLRSLPARRTPSSRRRPTLITLKSSPTFPRDSAHPCVDWSWLLSRRPNGWQSAARKSASRHAMPEQNRTRPVKIGVLAVQGAFAEHINVLRQIGVDAVPVRLPRDLEGVAGLILPGGESTTMRKLIDEWGLRQPIMELITKGAPIFGTCAGMILLRSEISDGDEPAFP